MSRTNVYIRMHHRIEASLGDTIKIGDVVTIANRERHSSITRIPVHTVASSDESIIIINLMEVIEKIQEADSSLDIQHIGPPETIVSVKRKKKSLQPIYFALVWFLLFIGAGLAIMNFHEDVSMNEVHQRLFRLVTGNESAKPLLLQIPYSIGLGVGMILFFNHFFKKRLSDEPSPLEVEMFNYQQALDQYAIRYDHYNNQKKQHAD